MTEHQPLIHRADGLSFAAVSIRAAESMPLTVPTWLLHHAVEGDLHRAALQVYLALQQHALYAPAFHLYLNDGEVLPEPPATGEDLAEECGVGRSVFKQCVDSLAKVGALRVEKRHDEHGGRLPNGYVLTPWTNS